MTSSQFSNLHLEGIVRNNTFSETNFPLYQEKTKTLNEKERENINNKKNQYSKQEKQRINAYKNQKIVNNMFQDYTLKCIQYDYINMKNRLFLKIRGFNPFFYIIMLNC